ncbi:MAG: hypothetical protein ACXIVE_05855 [Salinarimonas sp.]
MITELKDVPEFALDTPVLITGRIIGRSEFSSGPGAYYVEFLQRGKPERAWFLAEDLAEEADDD